MRQVDPRAMFVVDKATTLIAAGGAYEGKTLEDAMNDVMCELMSASDFFEGCDCDSDDDGNAPTSGSLN